ncbi:MAG: hypothetical protein OXI81_02465 [Paracoccaceae bacterium]|nr:hypothetical protein [Paracoccaceae bacterium]
MISDLWRNENESRYEFEGPVVVGGRWRLPWLPAPGEHGPCLIEATGLEQGLECQDALAACSETISAGWKARSSRAVNGPRPGTGQISDIKRGSGNRRDEILVFGPETGGMGTLDGSANLAQGGVRRRLWPDENERESLVAQPEGEFTIPCESEGKPWPGALDEPGEEAHVVAGDRIRWIEFAPDGGQDAVGTVAATVDAVKPGYTQKRRLHPTHRHRLDVMPSPQDT